MKTPKLGQQGLVVSKLGLGCTGMSEFYGSRDDDETIASIYRAIELGVTFFDTADMCGPFTNVAAADAVLPPAALARIDASVPKGSAAGERYPDMSSVNR